MDNVSIISNEAMRLQEKLKIVEIAQNEYESVINQIQDEEKRLEELNREEAEIQRKKAIVREMIKLLINDDEGENVDEQVFVKEKEQEGGNKEVVDDQSISSRSVGVLLVETSGIGGEQQQSKQ
ncbi:unnamed protein product [Heterosigma akashiwo]